MAERAIVFIDGNNWFHSLKAAGAAELSRLDYARISRKLLGRREWVGTRYYVGQVEQRDNPRLYADQRRFLGGLTAADHRISCHLGRLERRVIRNPAAEELLEYLASLTVRIDPGVFQRLIAIGRRHHLTESIVEKAVDVMLAVDLVVLAERDTYDAAYLLSADGDFTPAVVAARAIGKRVYAVSLSSGAQLAAVVNSFIRLDPTWLGDCYR